VPLPPAAAELVARLDEQHLAALRTLAGDGDDA
jgi:hypothetical protein